MTDTLGIPTTGTTQMRMARMLRLYIAASDLTQKQVAADAGIAESTLSRFLSGEQMPDARGFLALLAWCWGEHKA
jgi:transcriptional regulator with XRE-family HTH domain